MSTPDPKLVARARVTLTIEVDVGDHWGSDCPMTQVYRQAAESAIDEVRTGLDRRLACGAARIVGEPTVTAILVEKKRD